MLHCMHARHLHARTRPFRYAGCWTLAVAWALLGAPMPACAARTSAQVWLAVGFCSAWPWVSDRLRVARALRDERGLGALGYLGECALLGAVLGWSSAPPLVGVAAALCLLAGAVALAGWRWLAPALAAGVAGAAPGAALSPGLTASSLPAVDALAASLMLGFALALAHLSHRQALRLDGRRRRLAAKSAELERLNWRMQRYLPRSLRERLERAPDEPWRWERRWLTVTFVDLVGFTALCERLDAEPLADILDDYLGALIPAAESRGGEVAKLLGDGVLVVFGLGEAGDRRASVGAALAFCGSLPALLDQLAAGWRRRGEPVALQMRAGIASGFCTLGDRGAAERLDFTLIGPPVNLASRLQERADVDAVLLDAASAALADPPHRLGPPRRLELKGLGPIPAFARRCRAAEPESS